MIKLPVRLCEAFGPSENSFLLDADDKYVGYDAIAAALNAAPTRAFGELTAEALETIFDEADEDVKRRLDKSSGAREWRDAIYAALFDRLQAFAAPVIPEGWRLVPVELLRFRQPGYGVDPVITMSEAEGLLAAGLADAPPAPLRTEAEVRAEARREALEEAARAADECHVVIRQGEYGQLIRGGSSIEVKAAIRALIEKEPRVKSDALWPHDPTSREMAEYKKNG